MTAECNPRGDPEDEAARFGRYLADGFGCVTVVDLADASSETSLSRSVVICHDPPEIGPLRRAMRDAPAGLLVCQPREGRTEPLLLQQALAAEALAVPFCGWTPTPGPVRNARRLIAVLESDGAPAYETAPSSFRVVAFVPTFNEADIIAQTLGYLIAQHIEPYVIDNWSTDDTLDRVLACADRGLLGWERFPREGPTRTYEWRRILSRVEELAAQIHASWFVLHDADERRYSPWAGLSLRDGLYRIEQSGFTCADHIVLNFWPTSSHFDRSRDVEQQLRHFSFSDHAGHFNQRKAWRNCGRPVSLAPSAGHDVRFPGRLVYPYKFLLKHYPIRSQEHGLRKVVHERTGRWSSEERALGWHQQYDELAHARSFLRDPATLELFDEQTFAETYLVERLSGIGVFAEAPPWSTGPRQPFDHADGSGERRHTAA
jgi:hypothetical protein